MNTICRRWALILVIGGVCASYLAISIGRTPNTYHVSYPMLATQFLNGRVSLPVQPDPGLLALPDPYDPKAYSSYPYLLDASLYHDKYYLYFGPVPAVVLFAPYRLVTGRDLPESVAVPLFCIGGYLSSCSLFLLLAERNRWALPFWLQGSVVTLLGSASMVYQLFQRPQIYQVAIAAGFCFVMSGFLALTEAMYRGAARLKLLLLAGLLLGLAAGCRPHLSVISLVVLGGAAIGMRRSVTSVVAVAMPMLIVGAGLALYNYVRFDNPFELGLGYQLTSFSDASVHRTVTTGLACLGEFLFLPPRVTAEAPFLLLRRVNPLPGRPGPALWTEGMAGLFPAAPLSVLGFLFPWLWRRWKTAGGDERVEWILHSIYGSGVLILVSLAALGWVLGRYLIDFAPLISLESAVLLAALVNSRKRLGKGRLLPVLTMGAAVYCLFFNLSLVAPRVSSVIGHL